MNSFQAVMVMELNDWIRFIPSWNEFIRILIFSTQNEFILVWNGLILYWNEFVLTSFSLPLHMS